jgi:hypothetical protein
MAILTAMVSLSRYAIVVKDGKRRKHMREWRPLPPHMYISG